MDPQKQETTSWQTKVSMERANLNDAKQGGVEKAQGGLYPALEQYKLIKQGLSYV